MPKFQRFTLRMGPPLSERTVEVTSSSVGTPSSQAFASPGPRIVNPTLSLHPQYLQAHLMLIPSTSPCSPFSIFFPTLYPREFSPHPSSRAHTCTAQQLSTPVYARPVVVGNHRRPPHRCIPARVCRRSSAQWWRPHRDKPWPKMTQAPCRS